MSDMDWNKHLLDKIEARDKTIAEQAREIERLRGIVPEVLEKLNDDLCDENEALRADAERYRWLRDEDDDPCVSLVQLFTETGKPEDVDAAIDAAIEAGKAVTP